MKKLTLIVILMLLTASIAAAQDFPRFEVFGGYSLQKIGGSDINELYDAWAHDSWEPYNPSTSKWLKNGFVASATINAKSYFGIEAAFQYNKGTMFEYNYTGDYIYEPLAVAPQYSESGKQKGSIFTFMAGPHFAARGNDRITPFAHALFGFSRANLTASASCMEGGVDCSSDLLDYLLEYEAFVDDSDTGFAMAFGGGLDVNVNQHFGIRLIQADYVAMTFEDVTLQNINLAFGVVLRSGN